MMTIRRKALLASALVALALPGLASAQYGMPTPPPPQSLPNQGQSAQADAAPAAPATPSELMAAATCVIGRNAAGGDALLATAPFSNNERQQALRLINDMQRCQHRPPIASSAPLIRGAFAEAVVEARFPAPQAAQVPELGVSPLLRVDQATTLATASSLTPAYDLAACTARQHPELVRALLATEPASDAAGAAFTALNPAFHGCVTPGSRINVDPRMLRGFLAESLYRWSVVQRDGPASSWAAAAAPAQTAAATAH